MNYSQNDLNSNLLSKSMSDFYIVALRKKTLAKSDMEILDQSRLDNQVDGDVLSTLKKNREFANLLMKINVMSIRSSGVVTLVNDQLYDIANCEFVDLNREEIIYYSNLTNILDESEVKLSIFTPRDFPSLKENTVLLDVIDENAMNNLNNALELCRKNADDSDLTEQFLNELKGKRNCK